MTNILDLNSVNSVLKNPEPRTPNPELLADQLDHLELQFEHAQAMARHSPTVFLKAAMTIASVDFFTVFNRFDTDALIKRLHEKPELYFQLMNSQFNLMKATLEQQKFEFKQKQTEARQRDRDQKLRARKPILLTESSLTSLGRTLSRSRRREETDAPVPASPASSIQHPPSNTATPLFSHSSNHPQIHSSTASLRPAAPPFTNPSIHKSNNLPSIPSTISNTANTGPSQFVEFNALDHAPEPDTQPIQVPTCDHNSWRDPVEQQSEHLVCCPS